MEKKYETTFRPKKQANALTKILAGLIVFIVLIVAFLFLVTLIILLAKFLLFAVRL